MADNYVYRAKSGFGEYLKRVKPAEDAIANANAEAIKASLDAKNAKDARRLQRIELAESLNKKYADKGLDRAAERASRINKGKFIKVGKKVAKYLLPIAGTAAAVGALPGAYSIARKASSNAVNTLGKSALKYGALAAVPISAAALYTMKKSDVDDDKYYLYNDDKVRTFNSKDSAQRYRDSRPDEHFTMNKGATLRQKLED